MKAWLGVLIVGLNLFLSANCRSQTPNVVVSEPLAAGASNDLEAFREKVASAYPDMDVVSVEGNVTAELAPRPEPPKPAPRVAIFVKNQSTKLFLNDEVDAMRDTIAAELAGLGMVILDSSQVVEEFRRYKVTTMEERMGLVDGLFTGGSVTRVAQMLQCDYIVTVSLLNADVRSRNMNGENINTYNLRLAVKVIEAAQGTSVFGKNFDERYPVNTAYTSADDMVYYHDLVDSAAIKVGGALAASAPKWRAPEPAETRMVSFKVRTTIDQLVDGLENGVRAPNELLDEMRRIVGGVTVELDGATIGSTPGTFKATPGLHQVRINRQWMQPWQEVVNIYDGLELNVGLELSTEGLAKFQSLEGFRAACAIAYAEAAWRKGIKVNYDTAAWRDVTQNIGNRGDEFNLEKRVINQDGIVNEAIQQDIDQ
jgi:hypothetical protein